MDLIYVRVGMYHGTEPLCQVKETRQVDHTNPKWDEWVDLEIAVPDIPRFANFFRYWFVPMRCDCTYIRRGGKGREWYRALSDWGPVLWVGLEIAVPDIPNPRSLTFFFAKQN